MSASKPPTPVREEVLAKIDKALQHVFDLCAGREKWTMRVPVDEDRDSDTIICSALRAAAEHIKTPASERDAGRQSTHWEGCGMSGPKHYECLKRECRELEAQRSAIGAGWNDA